MAEPLYCYPLQILCQPLTWWASAASWAQAILSALAIYWAARIATQQHRRDLFQRVSVVKQLLSIVCSVSAANSAHIGQCAREGRTFVSDVEYFSQLVQTLKQVPLQELPDGRLTHIVAGIARTAEKSAAVFTDVEMRGRRMVPPSPEQAKECADHATLMWTFNAQAVKVGLDYERKLVVFGLPGYWKWLRRKRKISKAPIEPEIKFK
ncbi:hypothetical protein [Stenotrophomonas geniculata]|uniref:hypothetical protein n=1 Tax=Stenotrophomonas geniculata TaxID=86188 RepID=UPI0005BAEFF2|nr:hypothetical protein [Stenotrophomonas geniculata]